MPPRCKPPVGEGANLTLTCLLIEGKDKFPQIFALRIKKPSCKEDGRDSWVRKIYGSSIVLGGLPSIVMVAVLSQEPSP